MMFEDLLGLWGSDNSEDSCESSGIGRDEQDTTSDIDFESEDFDEATSDVETSIAEYNSENESTEGASDIHVACMEGSLEEIKELIDEDISLLECTDKDERTPLHYACRLKRADVVEYLLNKGADVNAQDFIRHTPLHAAVNVTGYDFPGETTNESLKRREKRARNIVRILLDAGADLNAADSDFTVLASFVLDYFRGQRGPGNIPQAIIKMLLEREKKGKEELATYVIRWAVRYGDLELLQLCLENGGHINQKDWNESSLLHLVVNDESPSFPEDLKYKTLLYLLDKGCTLINHVGFFQTPLSCAGGRGYVKCMDLLLSRGAQVDVKQPLHNMFRRFVCDTMTGENGYQKIAKEVIRRGSVLDLERPSGISSLKFLLNPISDYYGLYQLPEDTKKMRIKRAEGFLKVILHENAMKLPSQRGFLLDTKNEDGDNRDMDIMNCPNIWIVSHLYQVGFKVREIEEILEDPDAQENLTQEQQRVLDEVKEMNLLSLQQLCRLKIRQLLSSPLSAKLQKLPLPKPMQDYLHMT